MPETKPQPKVLRIGIIQDGKFVEEQVIRDRKPVTIGTSLDATLIVPGSQLPRMFPI